MKNVLLVKVSLAEFTEVIFLMARYGSLIINIQILLSSLLCSILVGK